MFIFYFSNELLVNELWVYQKSMKVTYIALLKC